MGFFMFCHQLRWFGCKRRPKCAASLRQFLGSAQSEPDWRRNDNAQGARRGERQALLLSSISRGNVSSGTGRRRSWQAGVGNQCHDGERASGCDHDGVEAAAGRSPAGARHSPVTATGPAPDRRPRHWRETADASLWRSASPAVLLPAGSRCSAPTMPRSRQRAG